MDLKSSFHQLQIDPRDRHILTVVTETSKHSYTRLPQGLKISTSAFQREINKILSPHLYDKCLSYVDDLIVMGKTFQTQLENLTTVLGELKKFNIKLNTKKSRFMYTKIDILGHEVSRQGYKPMQSSIEAISKIQRPTSIRQLRGVIGLFSFFRKFIPQFSEICHPLTEAIKNFNKTKQLQWTQECENSLHKFKIILTTPPLLRHFNEDLECRLYTDSSNFAIGSALLQYDPETQIEHPIAYFSRKLKPSQLSHTITEKEFLALAVSVVKFREYLYGRTTHVYTDHSAIVYYKNFKGLSSRLTRMALQLVDYHLVIHYKKGKEMTLPDYLSRHPLDEEVNMEEMDVDTITSIVTADLKTLQLQDEELLKIIQALQNPRQSLKKYKKLSQDFILQQDILYKIQPGENRHYKIALPESLLPRVLQDFHCSPLQGGHFNSVKTYKKISERFYLKNLRKHVEQFVKICDSCQKRKNLPQKPIGLLNSIPPTLTQFSRIQVDIIGPLICSQRYKYILSVTCASTKFAFTFPLIDANAQSVAKCLLKLITTYGVFDILQSDRGTHFCNSILNQLFIALGNCHIFSSAYTPQVNGQVESLNKTLINTLSHYVQDKPNSWSQYLDAVTFCYNNTVHSTHKHKPAQLFLGFTPKLPSDTMFVSPDIDSDLFQKLKVIEHVRNTIPDLIKTEQERQKVYYDRRHRDFRFKSGDEVLVWFPKLLRDNTTKFSRPYKGPFSVIRQLTPVSYEIEIMKNGKLTRDNIHVSRLKLYHNSSQL